MRILLATNLFPPDVLGGYELLAADVAAGLRQRGHDVHVLTTGERRETDPPWVHRELTLVRQFGEPASLDRVRHALAAHTQQEATTALLEQGFDGAVIMSMRRLGLHVPRAIDRAGIPVVYCFNDDWLLAHRPAEASTRARRAVWSAIERVALGARNWHGVKIERAVYVSAAIREALRVGGAPVPEGVVCFQGVDRKLFSARPFRPVGRSPRLLYAGRVHPTKGVDVAIRALAEVRSRGLDARLTIAGTGAQSELDRLAGIAREVGVTESLDWRGFVKREALGDVYREHDVFMFPSLWEEPAGLTYLEAMACGVPVAAIARGGAKEVLVHGVNSLVGDDASTLARAVERMSADPFLVARLVQEGETTVRERASLERYVDAILGAVRHEQRNAA